MNQIVPSRALTGEVIEDKDQILVFVAESPFQERRQKHVFLPGLTIFEMLTEIGAGADRDWVVHLNGEFVEPRLWKRIRPKPGTQIVARVRLGEIFSGIAALIGAISAATAGISSFIGGLGIFGQILTVGLSIGFNLLLGALFPPPKQKQVDNTEPARGYSLGASRNSVAQFEAVPVVLGKHRFAPFYAAKPFTETLGLDQFVTMLFVWGYGPLEVPVENMLIGETPLTSFQDVTIENFRGYSYDTLPTLYRNQVIEETLAVDLRDGDSFNVRRTAEDVTFVSLDFYWPNGLFFVQKDGDIKPYNQTIVVQIADVTTGVYTDFNSQIFNGNRTRDARRLTIAGAVAVGQYDVRVTIIGESGNSSGTAYDIQKDVQWVALRGHRPGLPITFGKPLALTAIRMKASGQLNGALDTLNGIASSLAVNVFGSQVQSSNPADLYLLVMTGPANARPIPSGQIDMATLQAWHAYCAGEGWTYNNVITSRRSVYDMLLEIAAAGRAVPLFRDGLWSVVWDQPEAQIAQVFTPRNSWGFEASHEFRVLPHGWRTRFVNAKRDWIDDERIVYDDGYTKANATLLESLEFPGVTDPDLIWRHGRYHIAQLRLRPETYVIHTDFENLIVTKGDRVRVAHDVMLVGISSARIAEVNATTRNVRVDELIVAEIGKSYALRVRDEAGVVSLYPVSVAASETNIVHIDGAGPLPAVGDLAVFGESGKETAVFRVLQIERQDELSAILTLVDDAPGIALADNGTIPAFVSNITTPIDPYELPPFDIRGQVRVNLEGERLTASVYLTWKTPRLGATTQFQIEMRSVSESPTSFRRVAAVSAPELSATVAGLSSDVFIFRVRAVFQDGTFSRWVESAAISTMAIFGVPEDVEGLRISTNGDVATISWTAPFEPIRSTEVRYSPATSGATWTTSAPINVNAVGGSTQVSFQSGTYLVKHVSYGGVYSAVAASIVVANAGLQSRNVVVEIEELAPFDGSHDGTWQAPLGLELLSSFDAFAVPNLFSYRDAFLGGVGFVPRGVYTLPDVLDLGEVFTSRLTVSLMAQGANNVEDIFAYDDAFELINAFFVEPEDWAVEVEISTTFDDPSASPVWSDWTRLIVGDYAARAFRLRMILTATRFGITPRVTYLNVRVDMPDRVEAGRDVVVPVTGLRVAFQPAFRAVDGLSRSDQDLETGDRAIVTNLDPTGFDIVYRNEADSPVERTFDWLAKGYGKRIS